MSEIIFALFKINTIFVVQSNSEGLMRKFQRSTSKIVNELKPAIPLPRLQAFSMPVLHEIDRTE